MRGACGFANVKPSKTLPRLALYTVALMTAQACSMDGFQQFGYFITQNLQQQQCQKAMQNQCEHLQNYDQYQLDRQEISHEKSVENK